jgi:hypothetical protein
MKEMMDPGNRKQNWDDEDYYEFLMDQYENQEQEEEDIMGDID